MTFKQTPYQNRPSLRLILRSPILLCLLISMTLLSSTCQQDKAVSSSSLTTIPSDEESSPSQLSSKQVSAELQKSPPRSIPEDFMCFSANSLRVKNWREPQLFSATQLLAPKVIRIPGGEVANYWNWKKGGLIEDEDILPEGLPESYRTRRNYQAGTLDDFKIVLEETQTKPLFVLNILSSDLDTQLEKLKQAQKKGLPIEYIELGNELYFATRNNKFVFPKPEDYAEKSNRWISKIKQEFPSAKFSIIGVSRSDVKPGKKRLNDWNSEVYPKVFDHADSVSLHVYGQHGLNAVFDAQRSQYPFFKPEEVNLILGQPFKNWERIKHSSGFKDVPRDKEIWITEYNLLEKINRNPNRQPRVYGSWTHGLYSLSMSLLFLENPQISKICNHVLVGDSRFGAIYADENSLVNPANPTVSTSAFSLSATGSTLSYLGQALSQATTAQKLSFTNAPNIEEGSGFSYPGLQGWLFSNEQGRKNLILVNLASEKIDLDISSVLGGELEFQQLASNPRAIVTGADSIQSKNGKASNVIHLHEYSVTLLKQTQ